MGDLYNTFIAATPLLTLKPLGSIAERSHGRLTDLLRTEIGADAALLLAEPVPAPSGGHIDWYAPIEGVPIRAQDLPAEARAALTARLRATAGAILALADRFEAEGDRHRMAQALRNAVSVPGPECLWSIGGMPVLIAWGHAAATPADLTGGLRAAGVSRPVQSTAPRLAGGPVAVLPAAAAAAVAPAAAAPREGAGAAWPAWLMPLLWLLIALLAALCLYRLLTSGGVNLPGLGPLGWGTGGGSVQAPVLPAGPVRDQAVRGAALETQIHQAELSLTARLADCRGGAPAASPADLDRRLARESAGSGQLQISLAWDGPSDLDLIVMCPSGQQISFNARQGCEGGALDVDMNAERGRRSDTPVENIVWPNSAPAGDYRIGVLLYGRQGDARPEIPFQVRLRRSGQDEVFRGAVAAPRELRRVHSFHN